MILAREEVRSLLGKVRNETYRACLTTIYVRGLRLTEGARIQVPDIDGKRRMLLVHGKDRYVPTPAAARPHLRGGPVSAVCQSRAAPARAHNRSHAKVR